LQGFRDLPFSVKAGKASSFFTMELKMPKRKKLTPHLPLDENRYHHLNAMLPPFIIGGRDGDLPM
jgi:hypothetical protein